MRVVADNNGTQNMRIGSGHGTRNYTLESLCDTQSSAIPPTNIKWLGVAWIELVCLALAIQQSRIHIIRVFYYYIR